MVYIYIYIYIYTHTHTLTGHFIRYPLLVLGWTPFAFRTDLIVCGIDSTKCWKQSSEILVHIDMIASCSCYRFVGCTSMMRISRSTTSQRCSIGLRSGDCGGHFSKVSLSHCHVLETSRVESPFSVQWIPPHMRSAPHSLFSRHESLVMNENASSHTQWVFVLDCKAGENVFPLGDLYKASVVLSDLTKTWWFRRNCTKCFNARNSVNSFRKFMCVL